MEAIPVIVVPSTVIDSNDHTCAIISESLFERLFGNLENSSELLGINISADDKQISITCMPQNVEDDVLYLPSWACQHLGATEATIKVVEQDAMLRARILKVRILDDEIDHGLVRDVLEKYLYDFKFLQPHIILSLPIEEVQINVEILIDSIIDQDGIECEEPVILGAELELDILVEPACAPVCAPVEPEPASEPEPAPAEPKIPTENEKETIRAARLRRFGNV